ncbi:MAG: alpha/beta fold hydrolase [Burkholderiales bacterium]|jgi:pimeloyl-ACP methyl ester carboxylesterase|nr:alpha/beta fold hydrolase [Burkholderiales bacterium]
MLKPHIPNPTLRRALAAALLGLSLSSAMAAPPTVEAVQGRRVESQLIGPALGAPVVVFENGARMTLDTWQAVIDGLGRDVTLLTHNRPGYGRSEPADGPRSGEAVVEELRALLAAKGLKPPYVLVGHSMGGLYMQWFARRYPQEVQALVLVDSLYPRIIKKPEDFPWYARLGKRWLMPRAVSEEVDQVHATGESLLALPAFDDSRVVQLFNVPTSPGAIAVDFGVTNDDPATITFVKQLYPRSRKHIVDSDHQIQTDKPEVVVAAIREALALAPTRLQASSDSGR